MLALILSIINYSTENSMSKYNNAHLKVSNLEYALGLENLKIAPIMYSKKPFCMIYFVLILNVLKKSLGSEFGESLP